MVLYIAIEVLEVCSLRGTCSAASGPKDSGVHFFQKHLRCVGLLFRIPFREGSDTENDVRVDGCERVPKRQRQVWESVEAGERYRA